MANFNLKPNSIADSYQNGLLPQRNDRNSFYYDTSCRSKLSYSALSSENRRILNKTSQFTFEIINIKDFNYTLDVQKQIFRWIKDLGWDFPISSVKTIFTNHIFNSVYVWKIDNQVCAYSICYFDQSFSHVAYVFYDPKYSHSDLPIRLSLQVIIDSHQQNLSYCYLGRFNPETKLGYYKRNFPNFEYFSNNHWLEYK